MRLELAKTGLDLVDLHGEIQNTGKTGKELLRNTSEGTRISAMFCSRILAETLESAQYWSDPLPAAAAASGARESLALPHTSSSSEPHEVTQRPQIYHPCI